MQNVETLSRSGNGRCAGIYVGQKDWSNRYPRDYPCCLHHHAASINGLKNALWRRELVLVDRIFGVTDVTRTRYRTGTDPSIMERADSFCRCYRCHRGLYQLAKSFLFCAFAADKALFGNRLTTRGTFRCSQSDLTAKRSVARRLVHPRVLLGNWRLKQLLRMA